MAILGKSVKSMLVGGFSVLWIVAFGLAFQPSVAHAGIGENFSIDQSCDSSDLCSESGGTITDIDKINFNYQALVEQEVTGGIALDGDDIFFEVAFITWSSYIDDAGLQIAPTFLNNDYKVYGIVSASGTAELVGGAIIVDFTSFSISFFMDDDINTTLALPADVAPGTTADTQDIGGVILGNDGDDTLLATATLLIDDQARIFAGLASGDFEVILSDLGLATLGLDFLTDPVPFYNIMNIAGLTTQVTFNLGDPSIAFIAQLDGSGDIFFSVPEPSTLALFGFGLIAFGLVAARRRRTAHTAID
jgi:hypothetical protein